MTKLRQMTYLLGIIEGTHSNWAYRQLEAAVDGIVDFKVQDIGGERRDVIDIRMMRNVDFDRGWHTLKTGDTLEVTLEK